MDTTAVREPVRARSHHLSPRSRKLLLALHVIASVGWIGADLCLLLFGIRALTSVDARIGQGAVVQMADVSTWITGPLSVIALLTGIQISVRTRWGLFKHLWVVISLALTTAMTILVVFALGPLLRGIADKILAAPPTATVPDILGAQAIQLVIPPSVAFVALSFVTVINIMKPWGRTRRTTGS